MPKFNLKYILEKRSSSLLITGITFEFRRYKYIKMEMKFSTIIHNYVLLYMFSNLFIYVNCYVLNDILRLSISMFAKCLGFLFTTIYTVQIIDIYLRRRMFNSIQASVIQLQVVMKKYGQYPQLRQRQTEYANEWKRFIALKFLSSS